MSISTAWPSVRVHAWLQAPLAARSAILCICVAFNASACKPAGEGPLPPTIPTAGSQAGNAGATASGASGGTTVPTLPTAGVSASSAGTSGNPAGSAGHPDSPANSGSGASNAGAMAMPSDAIRCKQRQLATGDATLHMHHIHFNATSPQDNIAFIEKYFNGHPIDFCTDEASARTTRAIKTDRAFFLYTKTASAPPSMRNTRLAHVGFMTTDTTAELKRLLALNVPLADKSVCATAADGTPCNTFTTLWFYVETPEGARFEVSTDPGPSTSGFGHIHLVAPTYGFYQSLLGSALKDTGLATVNVDGVNLTNSGRSGMLVDGVTYMPTRGTVLDHIAYSTTDLEATRMRIEAAGITLAEPISFKPEFGFRSFFVRSQEDVWVEIVEDSPFAP